MLAIEFFSGIGGMAFAIEGRSRVMAAFDQNHTANQVYALNHGLPPTAKNITSVRAPEIEGLGAELWLMSPPCQPFTVRGKRRDLEDARNQGLLHLISMLPEVRPRAFFLENVVGFRESKTRERLLKCLTRARYDMLEVSLCPTELGIPNRRPRHYVLASLDGLAANMTYNRFDAPLSDYLDPDPDPALRTAPEIADRWRAAMDIVDGAGPAACFARSYGRTFTKSGSYLADAGGLRMFSPEEIARLLHFPPAFRFPDDTRGQDRYRLLGNSINVAVVRELARHFEWSAG